MLEVSPVPSAAITGRRLWLTMPATLRTCAYLRAPPPEANLYRADQVR
jgi:hypothetical protein